MTEETGDRERPGRHREVHDRDSYEDGAEPDGSPGENSIGGHSASIRATSPSSNGAITYPQAHSRGSRVTTARRSQALRAHCLVEGSYRHDAEADDDGVEHFVPKVAGWQVGTGDLRRIA